MNDSISTLVDIKGLEEFAVNEVCFQEELMPVPELVDQIVESHHAFLKMILKSLKSRINEIRNTAEVLRPDIEQCFVFFEQLAYDQLAHMNTEETVIFPYIKSLFENQEEALKKVQFGCLRSPSSVMEMEHENALSIIQNMSDLTNGFTVEAVDSPLVEGFLSDMALLKRDLERHIYKEDNILYPKAVQWETEYYTE